MPVKLCTPVHAKSAFWFTVEFCHVGAAASPFDVRNCPAVPHPVVVLKPDVPLPRMTCPLESDVEAVPPYATANKPPFHVPEVIVPIVERFASVVIEATDVVEFSIFPLLSAEKLLLSVVRLAVSVSVPNMVVIVVPKLGLCKRLLIKSIADTGNRKLKQNIAIIDTKAEINTVFMASFWSDW